MSSISLSSIGRYVASKGWAHVVLLCGLGLFLFPFLWMLGMSMKTDDEVTSGQLLPSVPTFRASSPFVRETAEPTRPRDASEETWASILPRMLDAARAKQVPGNTQLRETAARATVSQIVGRMDRTLWQQSPDAILAAFTPLLTDEVVSQAQHDRMARLELKQFQVRTLDGRIFNLSMGAQFARDWKVVSGPGQLIADGDVTYLKYDFRSASDPPIVLRCIFDFPEDPSSLHKLILGIRGDDSWHRIDATFSMGADRWQSAHTSYVCQYRNASIMYQPPTFDDTTLRPRKWIALERVGSQTSSERHAVLELTISPSSTLRAIWGKVIRNYLRAFYFVPFWKYVRNSVILVALQVVGAVLSSGFVAYAFARLNWPGRGVAMAVLLSTMMLPSQVTMIPSFMIWRGIGWYNTLNPLWVPAWFGSAFFIFLMTQNMKTIPRELEEAARLDGLNAVQTWWYIFMPLVKPTLAAIAVMVFMGAWSDFMGPLIMLRDQDRFPLSLGLFGMRIDQETAGADWTLLMAGNVLMTLPVVLIFFFFQRYFIQGVTMTGMKG